jgi:hypothetical protein
MNKLHHLYDDATLNLSRHEVMHGWMAHEASFDVERVEIDRDTGQQHLEGRTTIIYPLSVDNFDEHYERSPAQVAGSLVRVLSVIRAGSYAEVHGGMIGAEPQGRDLEHIAAWREAVLPIYGADGWTKIYASAFATLRNWYNYPRVREVLGTVALALAAQRCMSRYAFHDTLALAGANNCPPPQFVPVLPRRQPVPAPRTPAFSTSVRRRVALQETVASEPVLPGEIRKPANFGRNPDGTPRSSFTPEELACAQAIMESAARRHAGS